MKRPNILIFMTDQQRADSVTLEYCQTPNLDRFRANAVTFTNAFCPSPHCCPSRATFFSGLYPSEHGVWNNVNVANALSRGLSDGVRLWSEDLAEAGYDMTFSGKWHVSAVERPADRGWGGEDAVREPFTVRAERRWEMIRNSTYDKTLSDDRAPGEIIRPGWSPYSHYGDDESPFGDADVVEQAVAVIRQRAESGSTQPWCQYVGPLGPHDPYRVPKRFIDAHPLEAVELPASFEDAMTDKPDFYRRTRDIFARLTEEEHREAIRHYYALCSYEDHLFGRVLDALDAAGQMDDTIVIYTSDHGDYGGEHGLWCKGLPCFQGAYRIPMVVGWRGGPVKPGSVVEEFMSLADFAPTLMDAASLETERRLFGKSFLPLLAGERVPEWRDRVYTQSNGNELYGIQRSVMTREWKYVHNGFAYDELYHLTEDPLETRNLIGDSPRRDVVESLCASMWKFGAENNDACTNPYIMTAFAPYGPRTAFQS